MARLIVHCTLAVLTLFEGEDDDVLATLEAARAGFEAILLTSDNVELVTPDAMEVVVTECLDATDKSATAARTCLIQAGQTLEVEQLVSVGLNPLDDISFELTLEVWKPKKNSLLFTSQLALDATSVESAARSGLTLLAKDYLCFRESGKSCPGED